MSKMIPRKVVRVMAGLLALACLWTSGELHAGEAATGVECPQTWVAFGPAARDAGQSPEGMASLVSAQQLKSIPERLRIRMQEFEGKRFDLNTGIDLQQVVGEAPRGSAVYLYATITADQETDLPIGASADAWMQWWLDGEPVYDTLDTGNQHFPYSPQDHVFTVHLSPGEHVLTVCVVKGAHSFLFVAGAPVATNRRSWWSAEPAVRRAAYELVLANPYADDFQRVRGHLGLADLYMTQTECEGAREQYEKVLQMDAPTDHRTRARLGLGRAAMYQRDLGAAARAFRSVLQNLEARDDLDDREAAQARKHLKTVLLLMRMRKSHPRMFFNSDTWPTVAARAQGAEKERLEEWKQTVEERLSVPLERADWGPLAMKAAFVFRMTGDKALLDKVETLLRLSLEQYEYAHEHAKDADRHHVMARYGVSYVPYTRINWVAALDWVWDDLTPEVRKELASRMSDFVYAFMRRWGSKGQNMGFYYAHNLYWYAGLGLVDDELDEPQYRHALAVLETGWQDYQRFMDYRRRGRGDFGQYGIRLGYTLHHYPYAEWHFLHTWQSAVDERIPADWKHSALFSNGLLWNRLPEFRVFGFDVGWHTSNQLNRGNIYAHVSEHLHFYAEFRPQLAALSQYMREELQDLGVNDGSWKLEVCPFLLTNLDKAPPPDLPEGFPTARYAPRLGIVYMNSGFGEGDTYAALRLIGWKQRDSTHFVIYKQGFLALDTGARKGGPKHHPGYWSQTIAHNCVLIRMPGETFRTGYGGGLAPGNAGGQRHAGGHEHFMPVDHDPRTGPAKVLAFESHPEYAYAAGDATGAYHEDKCAQMVRQFVYLPPDHFVVFDRVTSTKAEYPKRWILHTANEPQMRDAVWHADQGEGRLFCQTLYPQDAVLGKVGGPGKEFWVDGENFEIPKDWNWWYMVRDHKPGEIPETMGRWRMEVKPGGARKEDWFLHVLQASSQDVDEMVPCELVEREGQLGATIARGGRTYTVTFNRSGEVGGRIRVDEQGRVVVDQDLTQEIMHQEGLALTE